MIRIVYIHYPVSGNGSGRKRPEWFDFELCFKNLIHTLRLSKVPFTIDVLMDGNPVGNWILNYSELIQLHEYPFCGGGAPLVQRIHEFVMNSSWPKNDLVYVLENDYIHVEGWPNRLNSAIDTFGRDNYFTLYDHPDKYKEKVYQDLTSQVLLSNDQFHWRTVPSTCFSFVTSKRLLQQDADVFLIPGILDHLLFTMLNCAKGRKLFSPIPSLSTHCMDKWMSPGVDWRLEAYKSNY